MIKNKQKRKEVIYFRRITGQSMLPSLRPGQICIFVKMPAYKHNDVVLVREQKAHTVKRLKQKQKETLLAVDNHAHKSLTQGFNELQHQLVARLVWPRR